MKKKLKELLVYEQPGKYIVKTEKYSDEYVTPVLTAGKSFVLGYTDETEGIFYGTKEPVIIFDDFTRDTKYVDFDFKVKSSAMKILHKCNKEDSLKYFHYAINSIKYTPFSHKRLWISDFSNFEVEYPTSEKQHEIVNRLDKIQAAIDNKKQQLALLDEAVKSKFVEMFGENPVESGKWKVENLGDVAEIKIGPFGSLLHKQDYIENGHCLVNPSHIKDGKIQVDYSLSVTDEKYNELKAYQLEINDIVLGRRGEMGRCAIVTENTLLCGTGSMIVRPNGKLKSFFLNFVLSSNVTKKYLEDNAIGVTMKNINEPLVKSISVPVIPLSLQNQFAAFVQQIDKAKSIAKQQLADLQELLDSKMQEYFA